MNSSVLRVLKKISIGVAILFCLVSASVIVYLYFLVPPYWDKTFGQLDERFYFAPQAFFLDVSLRNGEFPLWNPLAYCGMPFAADPQASAYYPPHLIRSILTPAYDPFATIVSIHILRFLHLLWAGLGLFFLARLYKLSIPACLVGAFAFMFNAFNIIYFTEFYVYPLVITWAPWILWAAKRTFLSEKMEDTLFFGCCTTLFFATSTLGGFPQLSLYLGLLLAFFGMLDILFNLRIKQNGMDFKQACLAIAGRMVLLSVIAVTTVLAACVLLLPAFELGSASARVVASGVEVATVQQNFNWVHLFKCLVFFPGNTWAPIGPRGAGIGALLVAMVAVCFFRQRNAWIFFLLYLIMTDCTLGPPFPLGALLHHFDFLNITVSPWRAGSFASLAFAMLAAFGVDAAGHAPVRSVIRALRMLVVVAAGTVMLIMLYAWLGEKTLYPDWHFVWILPLFTLIAITGFSWVHCPCVGRWTIAILVGAEIIVWSAQMLPVYVSQRVATRMNTSGFGEYKTISRTNSRYGNVRPNWNMFTLDFTMAGYNPLYIGDTRTAICKSGYENFYRGYLKGEDALIENHRGNLFLKRSFWLARQWVAGNLPGKEEVFPSSTTVFLTDIPSGTLLPVPEVSRDNLPAKAVSERVEHVELGTLDTSKAVRQGKTNNMSLRLPQFEQGFKHSVLYVGYVSTGVVDFRPTCKDENERVYWMKHLRKNNTKGEEYFLEIPLPDCDTNTITLIWQPQGAARIELTHAYVVKDMEDEGNHITIRHRTANTVCVTVNDLPEPRILVFVDSYYEGWQAWVDGADVKIMKANDAFKAITVPAGNHEIWFSYWSQTTRVGFIISVSTFLALLTGLTGIFLWQRFSVGAVAPIQEPE